MSDALSEFLGDLTEPAARGVGNGPTVVRELLVFEYGSERYAVPAMAVDAVITWKQPAVVPGADSRVSGVIQDRGRIVVLLMHPTGEARDVSQAKNLRIIICKTTRGYVGLPASVTNAVAPVELSAEPTGASLHDSSFGLFAYLDPERWVHEV